MTKDILMLDDIFFSRCVKEALEEKFRCRVDLVGKINDALTHLGQKDYGLLILDPIEFGYRGGGVSPVCSVIEEARRKKIKILLLTTMEPYDALELYGLTKGDHYDGFLCKPARKAKIHGHVQALLGEDQ